MLPTCRSSNRARTTLEGLELAVIERVPAADDGGPAARAAGRRASARTWSTRPTTRSVSRPPAASGPRRRAHARLLLGAARGPAGATGAGASRAPRSTWRCGRPGLPLARGARPRAAAGALRRLDRARQRRAAACAAASCTRTCASSSTRRASGTRRSCSRARRARRRGRRSTSRRPTPGAEASHSAGTDLYRWIVEALPNALIEDPGVDDPGKARSWSRTAGGSPGMRRSTRSPTWTRSRSRR